MPAKLKLFILNLFSKLRRLILGKYAVSVTYKTENGLIAIPVEDFTIGRKLGFQGRWDWDEIQYLSGLLSKDDVVCIIGTHVGTLLIPLAGRVKEVIGFEANPQTFSYLNYNLFLNQVSNHRVFNFAAGNSWGRLKFLQNKVNSGGSKIMPKVADYAFTYDNPDVTEVDVVPLDEFSEKHALPAARMIIMDIEGSEYFALQGMPKSLEACHYLYIEFEPHHLILVANCTADEFFGLFIQQFSQVMFFRSRKTFDLKKEKDLFNQLIESMFRDNISDDLLFSKVLPGTI